ncbi:unnamed protein product [Pocillopora meandrina]|uniref:Uncharacterized protein n=1 Tax=Pocillopora meandrina TaxID=46732 RepID=A0AAU9XCA2_9CNID|nr:unnamed protein product [Pocillopora meandrina]
MSLENMSEKECSPPKFLRLDDSLSESQCIQAENYVQQVINQVPCHGSWSSSNPVGVTILTNERGCRLRFWGNE